jgi:NADPH:quinone reductase-like Zn-dependent oxidoreductase
VRKLGGPTVSLGRDFAGVVEDTGGGVSAYQRGDEVFGFLPLTNPTVHEGSWAELISVPEDIRFGATAGSRPPNLVG